MQNTKQQFSKTVLGIDCGQEVDRITSELRRVVRRDMHHHGAVVAVSGGVDSSVVRLAGLAGAIAGAISMAAGEYVSMQTQRETMERQLHLEREHILSFPDEEQR